MPVIDYSNYSPRKGGKLQKYRVIIKVWISLNVSQIIGWITRRRLCCPSQFRYHRSFVWLVGLHLDLVLCGDFGDFVRSGIWIEIYACVKLFNLANTTPIWESGNSRRKWQKPRKMHVRRSGSIKMRWDIWWKWWDFRSRRESPKWVYLKNHLLRPLRFIKFRPGRSL